MNLTTKKTETQKVKTIPVTQFQEISRGTSLRIPVQIKRIDGTAFDLTDYRILFTLKAVEYDHDYDDLRALIYREIEFDEETGPEGAFDIILSSQETWLDPGRYFFDIEIEKGGAIARLAQFETAIVGGVTNRNISDEQSSIFMADAINLTVTPEETITFVTALVSDPPKDLIETIEADPPYIMEVLDDEEDPVRHLKFYNYGPRVSFPMTCEAMHDDEDHVFTFDTAFGPELPEVCPLKGGMLIINGNKLTLDFAKDMRIFVMDMLTHTRHGYLHKNQFFEVKSGEEFWLQDIANIGAIHFRAFADNDVIDIEGHYFMPDDRGKVSTWILNVNWYNWVD